MTLIPQIILDKESAVPLHYQLARNIEAVIADGGWMPDDELPNENEFCELLKVSRSTVRQAFRELLEKGSVYRPKPRGRLHVVPKRIHQKLGRLRGFFTEDMLTAGFIPSTRVLQFTTIEDPHIAEKLEFPPQTEFYWIQRLHHGDGAPMALQVSLIPKGIIPALCESEAERSLFTQIEDGGHKITRAVQKIAVRTVLPEERKWLRLPVSAAVFSVERITYAADNCAVEYFTCVLPVDRYDFTMDLPVSDRWSTSGSELSEGPNAVPLTNL